MSTPELKTVFLTNERYEVNQLTPVFGHNTQMISFTHCAAVSSYGRTVGENAIASFR